jgi:hypothetical protein
MSQQREMFAEPTAPRSKQGRMVLAHLRNEGPLTALEAINRYGVGRLAAVVFDLRGLGWNIVTDDLTVTKGDGSSAVVASYRLVRS